MVELNLTNLRLYWFVCFVISSLNIFAVDINGRIDTDVNRIPAPCMSISINQTTTSCKSACDGTASVFVDGGTGPFYYVWDTGENTASVSNLCAGTHTVSVIDVGKLKIKISEFQPVPLIKDVIRNPCYVETVKFTINVGNAPCVPTYACSEESIANCTCEFQLEIATEPASCVNIKDGKIDMQIKGGTPPYQINWADGNTSTSREVYGGVTYGVIVIDADNKSIQTTVPVGVNNKSCVDESDDLTIAFSPEINDIIINQVKRAVQKKLGELPIALAGDICPFYSRTTIKNPTAINASDGEIEFKLWLSDCGAVYTWVPERGQGTRGERTSLPAGNYTINGLIACSQKCGVQMNATISNNCVQSCDLDLSYDTKPSTVGQGNCNGTIYVGVVGGSGDYTYVWNDPLIGNTNIADQLCPGEYIVTVTDNQYGCTVGPEVITIEYLNSNFCNKTPCADPDESRNKSSNSTEDYSDDCYYPIGASYRQVNPSCSNSTDGGLGFKQISGGAPPYSYYWVENGKTTSYSYNLSEGQYTVIVRDEAMQEFRLHMPLMTKNYAGYGEDACYPDADCYGHVEGSLIAPSSYESSDGFISVSATFNSNPFYADVVWDDGYLPPVNTDPRERDNMGWNEMYSGKIRDPQSGCERPFYIQFIKPSCATCDLELSYQVSPSSQLSGYNCDGTIDVQVSGGSGNYRYEWDDTSIGNTAYANGLCPGVYYVRVIDENIESCLEELRVVVEYEFPCESPPCDGVKCLNNDGTAYSECFCNVEIKLTSYPSSCANQKDGEVYLTLDGESGPYKIVWPDGQVEVNVMNSIRKDLLPGVHQMTISDVNNRSWEVNYFVGEGRDEINCVGSACPMRFNMNVLTPTEPGLNDGRVAVAADLLYGQQQTSEAVTWTDDPLNNYGSSRTDLGELEYYSGFISIDSCQFPFGFSMNDGCVIEPPTNCELVVEAKITQLDNRDEDNPFNSCIGEAQAIVSGGSGNYDYLWSNGDTYDYAYELCEDQTYVVRVIDQSTYCIAFDTLTMKSCNGFEVDIYLTPAECITSCDGIAYASVFNGEEPMTYTWYVDGQVFGYEDMVGNLCTGSLLRLVVEDNIGCIEEDTMTVNSMYQVCCSSNTKFEVTNLTDAFCEGYCDGSVTIVASGDVPPYSISWTGGNTNFSRNDLCVGYHHFTIINGEGCQVGGYVNVGSIYETCCPPIKTENNLSACAGGVFALNAEGASQYFWSPAEFIEGNPNQASVMARIEQSTMFHVLGYIGACKEYREAYVFVTVDNDAAQFRIGINPKVEYVCDWSGNFPLELVTENQNNLQIDYTWTPTTGLNCDDNDCFNPTVYLNPSKTILNYTVTAIDETGCIQEASSVLFKVPEYPDQTDTVMFCGPALTEVSVGVENAETNGLSYNSTVKWFVKGMDGEYSFLSDVVWGDNTDPNEVNNFEITIALPIVGNNKHLKAIITDQYGCEVNYFVLVQNQNSDFQVSIDTYDCTTDSIQAHIVEGDFDQYVWKTDDYISCDTCLEPYLYIMSNELNFTVTGSYAIDLFRPDFVNRCVVSKEINHILDNTGEPRIIATQLNECRYRFEVLPEGFETYTWLIDDDELRDTTRIISNYVFYNDGFHSIRAELSSTCTSLEADTLIELIFEDCYCHDRPLNQL
jgi:hypothetical protein